MLTCPVCDTPNADGSASCEQCQSSLGDPFETTFRPVVNETVVANQQATVAATFGQPTNAGGIAPVCAFRAELQPGEVVAERYKILARLGQGGMGTVYKAHDKEVNSVIAIKTIRPDLLSNSISLRRLKQEVLLARQISHRNVIRVFDLGVGDGLRFIIMEYVEGEDLKAVVHRRGKLPLDESLDIITQVCAGLEAAHNEDVLHRDLKPQNIILSPDGRARLMDFGLARTFENSALTQNGTILGTPAYMSPEQVMGTPGDARSDLFSFGVVAYELLAGQLPYPGRTLAEAYTSRTRDAARPIQSLEPAIPDWLARIIMRCLERKLSDRYSSAREILNDLVVRDVSPVKRTMSRVGVISEGDILGSRYRIESEAGEGGMGKVYRATDLSLERTVALKVVRPELAQDPSTIETLKHEISVASQISHQNVLRIHDFGESDGVHFVSMAWAEGEDLRQHLRQNGILSEAEIYRLALPICDGLDAAHQQGIAHRDLKPSNILLTSQGQACIADFGLARSLGVDAHLPGVSGEIYGTPRYMSPEQADGLALDLRTDIYSFGLILYEMATGRIPFRDETIIQTLAERTTDTPASPQTINPALSDRLTAIILRCLERDPASRYASIPDLLLDLRAAETAFYAPPVLTVQKRSKASWAYAALGVFAALALVFYWRSATVATGDGKYVAVLPFRPLGSDPQLKYRAEGMAETVSARLASLTSVHPISATAVDAVNRSLPQERIAKQLGANLLLQGIVQQEKDRESGDDRIKVNVALYNTDTHRTVWSKSYDSLTEDLFTLEDKLGSDVVAALSPTPEERRRSAPLPMTNLQAYDPYLAGRDTLKTQRDLDGARKALKLFDQAIANDASYALAWTGKADANLLLYRLTKDAAYANNAQAAAEKARDLSPNLPEVYFALGSTHLTMGRPAEARSEIRQALKLAPNSDDGYIRLGKAYLANGQNAEAIKAFQRAVELNPKFWYNYKQLGWAYDQLGDPASAAKAFAKQIELNPSDPVGYSNLGGIYEKLGQWDKAIPQLQKAIEVRPSSDAYSNLATAYVQAERYKEAIVTYKKSLDINPNQAEILRNLAEAYTRTGQQRDAAAAYDRAIQLFYDQLAINPRDASVYTTLALCYAGKGDYSKAHELITRARSIDRTNKDYMYDEALIDAGAGNVSESLASLKEALAHGASYQYALSDPDLKKVRESPGFAALTKQFSQTAEARR